jgi:hypothetical protein
MIVMPPPSLVGDSYGSDLTYSTYRGKARRTPKARVIDQSVPRLLLASPFAGIVLRGTRFACQDFQANVDAD